MTYNKINKCIASFIQNQYFDARTKNVYIIFDMLKGNIA